MRGARTDNGGAAVHSAGSVMLLDSRIEDCFAENYGWSSFIWSYYFVSAFYACT